MISNAKFDELRGLAKGIICDGEVVASEADALRQWLVSNCEVIDDPSCQALAMLLIEMLRDAQFDATDSAELKRALRELIDTLPRSSPDGEGPITVYTLRTRPRAGPNASETP